MTWFLIAMRQEVKRIDNSVVVHALELAIKRDLMFILTIWLVKYTLQSSN